MIDADYALDLLGSRLMRTGDKLEIIMVHPDGSRNDAYLARLREGPQQKVVCEHHQSTPSQAVLGIIVALAQSTRAPKDTEPDP